MAGAALGLCWRLWLCPVSRRQLLCLFPYVSNATPLELFCSRALRRLRLLAPAMVVRLRERLAWHWHGLLLWLVRTPQLRYVPFPWKWITSKGAWKDQSEGMVQRGAWPRRWHTQAVQRGSFKDLNLGHAVGLCNKCGMRFAFQLEDEVVLEGLHALKAPKGQREGAAGGGPKGTKPSGGSPPRKAIRKKVTPAAKAIALPPPAHAMRPALRSLDLVWLLSGGFSVCDDGIQSPED